ncbi:hypothetical protein MSIBF_A1460027 [groundwater metagenome]|uniref:Transposase n=1 Tax=groundwater metagenome TaxID=717931 RepID=A0A098E6B0_9ZZZZ
MKGIKKSVVYRHLKKCHNDIGGYNRTDIYCSTAEIALFIEWHIVCCLRTRDLLFAYLTVS